jgi:hypothetical protein
MIEVHTNRRPLNFKSMLLFYTIKLLRRFGGFCILPAVTAPDDIGGGGLLGPVLTCMDSEQDRGVETSHIKSLG